MSADDTSEPSMVFRPGLQTPIPVEGRPFHDLGVWASALQPGDDAAFELIGRIVSEFGKIEFDLGELSLDLAHAGFLSKANNAQKRFPGTISKKISFIRFCFDVEGPISPYRRGGHRFLDRLKMQFDYERIRYAHSAIELNLMHSQDGIARFSFQIIKEFEKSIRQDGGMLNERRVFSVYEILDDYKKIRLSAAIVRRFRNYMRLRKGLKDAPSEMYPPLDLEE